MLRKFILATALVLGFSSVAQAEPVISNINLSMCGPDVTERCRVIDHKASVNILGGSNSLEAKSITFDGGTDGKIWGIYHSDFDSQTWAEILGFLSKAKTPAQARVIREVDGTYSYTFHLPGPNETQIFRSKTPVQPTFKPLLVTAISCDSATEGAVDFCISGSFDGHFSFQEHALIFTARDKTKTLVIRAEEIRPKEWAALKKFNEDYGPGLTVEIVTNGTKSFLLVNEMGGNHISDVIAIFPRNW